MVLRNLFLTGLAASAMLVEPGAMAATPPVDDPDCGGNTMQMAQCANRIFEREDRELNQLWKEMTAALEREDRKAEDHREPRLDIARKAQRAWVAYRDAQCAADADAEARGGTIYPLVYIGCRTEMTRARIQQLRPTVGN